MPIEQTELSGAIGEGAVPRHSHIGTDAPRVNIRNLEGKYELISSAASGSARTFYDSEKLYLDATSTYRIYKYISDAWCKIYDSYEYDLLTGGGETSLHSHAAAAPLAHASSHQNGGSDEISVAGLSGELADDQPPKDHASDHQNGGSDEISVAGLSGELADDQPPKDHASDHEDGGSDEMSLGGLAGKAEITFCDTQVLTNGYLRQNWTDIDMSATVGSTFVLAFIYWDTGNANEKAFFRRNGSTDAPTGTGANQRYGHYVVRSDSSGIIEYHNNADGSGTMQVYLRAYIKGFN